MGIDKRIIIGGLSEHETRALLVEYLTIDMRRQAGFVPPVMPTESVTPVTTLIARPLVLLRNKPVFHMSAGHVDFCVDYLRENGMPCQRIYIDKKRKQADGTWKIVEVASSTIQEFVDKLRLYVNRIDAEYKTAQEGDNNAVFS